MHFKILKYFGIMDRMFPGLLVNQKFDVLQDQRNPRVVLAWLLKDNAPEKVAQELTALKYTGTYGGGMQHKLPNHVEFLLRLLDFSPEHVYKMSLSRDKLRPDPRQTNVKPEDFQEYVTQHNGELMTWAILNNLDLNMISNFINFQRTVSGYDPRLIGKKGPELGKAIQGLEQQNFEAMARKKR